jgi:hypothetical protein
MYSRKWQSSILTREVPRLNPVSDRLPIRTIRIVSHFLKANAGMLGLSIEERRKLELTHSSTFEPMYLVAAGYSEDNLSRAWQPHRRIKGTCMRYSINFEPQVAGLCHGLKIDYETITFSKVTCSKDMCGQSSMITFCNICVVLYIVI